MKVLFCKETGDINYMLSRSEAKGLKREKGYTPILTAEFGDFTFHLSNSVIVKESPHGSGIQLIEPRNKFYLHYHTKITDKTYGELICNERCGTRYGNSSKLNIIIDKEL